MNTMNTLAPQPDDTPPLGAPGTSAEPPPATASGALLWSLGAVVFFVAAYAAWPGGRHAALALLCLTVAWGMFRLTPAEVTKVGVVSLALLGSTVLTLWALRADGFDPLAEGVDALIVCLVLPVLSHAAHWVGRQRQRLREEQTLLASTVARLESLTSRDPMTGLFNQKHMMELMERHAKRAHRAQAPLAVALLDLDHFRQLNDRHGHDVGDIVLADLARCASEALRETDLIARWGGEEFVVLFVDSDEAQAALGLERLRAGLSEQRLASSAVPGGVSIRFSAGLANWQPDDTPQVTLQRLDDALRLAKQQGRDRTVVAASAPAAS